MNRYIVMPVLYALIAFTTTAVGSFVLGWIWGTP